MNVAATPPLSVVFTNCESITPTIAAMLDPSGIVPRHPILHPPNKDGESQHADIAQLLLGQGPRLLILMRFKSLYKLKLNQYNNKLSNDQHIYSYYEVLREEIKREDTITHQRITWSITFQGFLISASALLLVFGWPGDGSEYLDIEILRRLSIFGIGILGLWVA